MFGEDAGKIPEMKIRWQHAARKAGLPLGERTHSYNSRQAQEMAKWAKTEGCGKKFRQGIYKALFVDGKNIAQTSVLADLAESAGLSGKQAIDVLETRAFSRAVDADWARGERFGIELVPTCRFNGTSLENPQAYDLLAQFLIERNVNRRNTVS